MSFDFGTDTSPVASGYARVSPATVFSAGQGYGWQSGTIDSRDRGMGTQGELVKLVVASRPRL
jgi:rhamnogalacturonan endolyase